MLNLSGLEDLYIIAEIGCNHNGEVELGKKMIAKAKECGADAVKFQYFNRDNLFTDKYLQELEDGTVKLENVDEWKSPELGLDNIRSQIDAFSNDEKKLLKLREYAKEIGIDFGCTPVDEDGVRYLKKLNVDFIKLSSMDANNPSMISSAIRAGLPLIISTGMSDLAEIDNVYRMIKKENYNNFALLHCVSIYPPREEIINLNFMNTMQSIFECEIGYSDHSLGFSIPLGAIAKGAKIVEKHFTLDKNMQGWDHKVSADPSELKIISQEGRRIFKALGGKYKYLSNEELEKRKKFRRSITIGKDIKEGDILTKELIVYKRPGTGIAPELIEHVIGRKAKKDILKDTTLNFEDLM